MRTLNADLETLAAAGDSRVVWGFEATIGATTVRWASAPTTEGGNAYEAALKATGEVAVHATPTARTMEVETENLSYRMSDLMRADVVQGSPATVWVKWGAAPAAVVFKGVIASVEFGGGPAARIRLKGQLDPTEALAVLSYAAKCRWEFKSTECGYAGGLTDCAHDVADCTTRARLQSFGGFPTLDAGLQRKFPDYEPPRKLDPEDDFLDDYYDELGFWD